MSELGEAKGRITIDGDFSGLDEGAEKVTQFRKKVDEGTQSLENRFGPALDQTARNAGIAGGAILAGFAVAANSAADFEARLSAIQAVSGATAAEMDTISEAALRIGADTSFSAGEAALAMEELIKAGLSTEDVLNGAADATVALAAAGEVALPEAATIASNAMNQFNLAAEDMVSVSDLIAGAANASAIDVSQFGYSLSQVGAVANLAGISFNDTATAIALMGNAGIVGSDAGTSLKSMLMRLNPSTREATLLMEELGIITEQGANQFYDAEGNMRSMAEIADVLQGALAGGTAEWKQATLATLFGSDAIRGAAIIAEGGAAAFNEMNESMLSVTAADVAATRLDNFKGSLEALQGSIETLAIRVGQFLLPQLRAMAEQLTSVVNWIGGLDDATLQAATQFGLMAGGILTAVGAAAGIAAAFLRARTAILAATGATQLFGVATTGVSVAQRIATIATAAWNAVLNMNPIVRIIGLVLALGAAVITMAGGWDTVIAAIAPIGEQMMAAFAPLLPVVQQLGATIAESLGAALAAILPALVQLATAIMPIIIQVFEAIAPIIGALAEIIAAILVPVLQLLGPLFEVLGPVISALMAVLQPLIDLLMGLLAPVLDVIVLGLQLLADGLMWVAQAVTDFFSSSNGEVSQAQSVWETFTSWLTDVWNGIVTFFQDTVTNITNFFTSMGEGITTAWNNVVLFFQTIGAAIAAPFIWLSEQIGIIWAGIMTVIQPVIDWFGTHVVPLITAAINLVVAVFTFLWNTIVMVWTAIWTTISTTVTNIWNTIVTIFTAIWTTIVTIVTAIWTTISTIFTSIWNTITSIVTSIWNTVSSIFNSVWQTIVSIFNNIYNTVRSIVMQVADWIRDRWNEIVATVTTIFNNVYNAIKDPLDRALNFIGGIKDTVIGFFSDAGSWLVNAGKNIIQGLINGVEDMLGGLTGLLNNITGMIPENKGPEEVDKKLLTPNGQMIMQGLIRGIASRVPELKTMLAGLTNSMPDMLASAQVSNFLTAVPTSSKTKTPDAGLAQLVGSISMTTTGDPGADMDRVLHKLRVYERGGR